MNTKKFFIFIICLMFTTFMFSQNLQEFKGNTLIEVNHIVTMNAMTNTKSSKTGIFNIAFIYNNIKDEYGIVIENENENNKEVIVLGKCEAIYEIKEGTTDQIKKIIIKKSNVNGCYDMYVCSELEDFGWVLIIHKNKS